MSLAKHVSNLRKLLEEHTSSLQVLMWNQKIKLKCEKLMLLQIALSTVLKMIWPSMGTSCTI